MHINISIVSHGHFNLIKSLNCVSELVKKDFIRICILDNIGEEKLKEWCKKNNIFYINNPKKLGFGENNNRIFSFFLKSKFFNSADKFLVLNPDVIVSSESIYMLADLSNKHRAKVSTLNLYKDDAYTVYDNAVRRYPTIKNYLSSMFFGKNASIIDKTGISQPSYVDWAAGSFLMFDAQHYNNLQGFDTGYFMYCEDIDLCLRSDKVLNEQVLFFPNIKAQHLAKHASRSIFSKHLYWHLRSMFRFLIRKNKFN